jgi:hypothetical protein
MREVRWPGGKFPFKKVGEQKSIKYGAENDRFALNNMIEKWWEEIIVQAMRQLLPRPPKTRRGVNDRNTLGNMVKSNVCYSSFSEINQRKHQRRIG